jgi:hypothetical protein
MENPTRFTWNRRRWAVQLALTTGLALLFFAVLLGGLRGVTPARADAGTLYVDGASGQDTPTCGATIAPCHTISYTLNSRASDGDTILIAAGTYTENLTITGITVTLRGGYTISATQWLTDTGQTVVNGNHADRTMVIHDSNSVLENLTITNGQTPGGQCWGGGLWVSNGSVTIRSSVITNSTADCSGGGIEVNSDLGPTHLTIEDSVISNNLSRFQGGGLAVHDASAALIRTTVVSNTANGGGNGFGGGLGAYSGSR